ncbi:MAG: hypothetical protein J6O39_06810 [Treponema sp.]|nr:hypothetical protein [Treponema sp.]
MKKFTQSVFKTLLPSAAIVSSVLMVITPSGCHSVTEGLTFLEGDFSTPQISSFTLTGTESAEIAFSKEISQINADIFRKHNPEEKISASEFTKAEGNCIRIRFSEKTKTGCAYVMEGSAADDSGNSVTFSIPFTGWNENPAVLVLNEVRNSYGTVKENGSSVHKTEFAEVFVLKGGNLSGLEICSLCDGEEKKYVFPPVEVSQGEYITVHMRTPENTASCPDDGKGTVSETGTDLSLSTHIDSCDSARDFWAENTKTVFADTDIIMIRDGSKIYDCLYYAKSSFEGWKEKQAPEAKKILNCRLWEGEPVCSDAITTAATGRSFSRQNLKEIKKAFSEEENKSEFTVRNSRNSWLITADSGSGKNKVTGVTPGYENSSSEYRARAKK